MNKSNRCNHTKRMRKKTHTIQCPDDPIRIQIKNFFRQNVSTLSVYLNRMIWLLLFCCCCCYCYWCATMREHFHFHSCLFHNRKTKKIKLIKNLAMGLSLRSLARSGFNAFFSFYCSINDHFSFCFSSFLFVCLFFLVL